MIPNGQNIFSNEQNVEGLSENELRSRFMAAYSD